MIPFRYFKPYLNSMERAESPRRWLCTQQRGDHSGLEPLNRLITFGRFAIASLVLLLALVLAHKFLPAGRRSLRDIAPGILLTLAMWIAAGNAFGSYLAEFARNYVTTYAGLASVMIALVFLHMIRNVIAPATRTRFVAEDDRTSRARPESARRHRLRFGIRSAFSIEGT
jgi:uncharacterized BrkB/YihY/UPF0761 family membrane protein